MAQPINYNGMDRTQMIAELRERDASFQIRWEADMRAIKRWQEAHPGRDLTWPDHADLVVWLMEQLDANTAPVSRDGPS